VKKDSEFVGPLSNPNEYFPISLYSRADCQARNEANRKLPSRSAVEAPTQFGAQFCCQSGRKPRLSLLILRLLYR
jgi:hypothetical protein